LFEKFLFFSKKLMMQMLDNEKKMSFKAK